MTLIKPESGSTPEKPKIAWKQYPVVGTKESFSEEIGSPGRRTHGRMATIKDDDERLLARIGYRQVR